ncbi:MAG: DNA methylase, partial [Firmicutes bacterium HGW-Firmicutes-17]
NWRKLKMEIEKLNLESMNITENQKAKLKELFPEVFTEGDKIDFDRLKMTLGEVIDSGKERYGMTWNGKSECFRLVQQPSRATLIPAKEESVNFDESENLFIEGDNLEVLKLLQKSYFGKVKMIYIDPPYNTGNDSFKYNDSFNHSTWLTFMKNRLSVANMLLTKNGVIFINVDDKEYSYLKVVCDDVFGRENFLNVIAVKTSDPSGHKTVNPSPYSQTEYILLYAKNKQAYKYEIQYIASDYDSGYNQLITNFDAPFPEWQIVGLFDYLAKEKGYKDTRDANKQLGHNVFQSIVADFALENRERIFQGTAIADDAAKDIVEIRNKSKSSLGDIFKVAREKEDVYIKDGRQIYFYSNKVREIDGVLTPSKPLTNLWTDIPYNGISKEGGVKLKNGKKPEKLLRRIIEISTEPNDIVLDFHLGSGTTCAVAHKLGRQYIGVEQLDYGQNDSVIRLKNVVNGDSTGVSKIVNWQGGGNFVYLELKKYNQTFIDQIEEAKDTEALLKIWEQMKSKSFLNYIVDIKKQDEHLEEFKTLTLADQKQHLCELLDKNQLYVNLSSLTDTDFACTEEEKKVTQDFYQIKK